MVLLGHIRPIKTDTPVKSTRPGQELATAGEGRVVKVVVSVPKAGTPPSNGVEVKKPSMATASKWQPPGEVASFQGEVGP